MSLKVKKEIVDLCLKMRNAEIESREWKQAKDELIHIWKFTPFNLLALYQNPPAIEYNDDNFDLVLTEKEA